MIPNFLSCCCCCSVDKSPKLNSAKVAEFSKPTMALFANINAAHLKKGNIIMFAIGSSSPGRVAPRADRCLGGQFAYTLMYYGVFSTIVNTTQVCLGGGCGVCFGDEKGFHVGFNIQLP